MRVQRFAIVVSGVLGVVLIGAPTSAAAAPGQAVPGGRGPEHDYPRAVGPGAARGGERVREQRPAAAAHELFREAETPRAARREQHARDGGAIASCGTSHVATILKP